MSSSKTNKSFTKRLKVTKKGKVLVRKGGQNHFNAKHSGEKKLKKRNLQDMKIAKKTLESNIN